MTDGGIFLSDLEHGTLNERFGSTFNVKTRTVSAEVEL